MAALVRPSRRFHKVVGPPPEPVWYECVPILGPGQCSPGLLAAGPTFPRIPGPGRTPPVCSLSQLPLRSFLCVYVIRPRHLVRKSATNEGIRIPTKVSAKVREDDGMHGVLVLTKTSKLSVAPKIPAPKPLTPKLHPSKVYATNRSFKRRNYKTDFWISTSSRLVNSK